MPLGKSAPIVGSAPCEPSSSSSGRVQVCGGVGAGWRQALRAAFGCGVAAGVSPISDVVTQLRKKWGRKPDDELAGYERVASCEHLFLMDGVGGLLGVD